MANYQTYKEALGPSLIQAVAWAAMGSFLYLTRGNRFTLNKFGEPSPVLDLLFSGMTLASFGGSGYYLYQTLSTYRTLKEQPVLPPARSDPSERLWGW